MNRNTRRMFLQQTAAITLSGLSISSGGAGQADSETAAASAAAWYRRTFRWAQTNITEIDPAGYDIDWWRQHWKRTRVQGVILNAGGIVAYYPSKYPLHYRPPLLGDRDLYGELAKAAHDDGLAVLARMDSNRTHEDFYRAHPDWFAVDASDHPYRAGELYVTCVNSPYYDQYLPDVLREIIGAHNRKASPITAGAGWGETVSATARTVRENSRNDSTSRFPARRTGMTLSTAIGSGGITIGGWKSGS